MTPAQQAEAKRRRAVRDLLDAYGWTPVLEEAAQYISETSDALERHIESTPHWLIADAYQAERDVKIGRRYAKRLRKMTERKDR